MNEHNLWYLRRCSFRFPPRDALMFHFCLALALSRPSPSKTRSLYKDNPALQTFIHYFYYPLSCRSSVCIKVRRLIATQMNINGCLVRKMPSRCSCQKCFQLQVQSKQLFFLHVLFGFSEVIRDQLRSSEPEAQKPGAAFLSHDEEKPVDRRRARKKLELGKPVFSHDGLCSVTGPAKEHSITSGRHWPFTHYFYPCQRSHALPFIVFLHVPWTPCGCWR